MTDALDRLLPPDPAAARAEPAPTLLDAARPARIPDHIARKLEEAPGDRSAQLAGLVIACLEWGYSDGEILTLALEHRPTMERQKDRRGFKVDQDVNRLLGKHRASHQHLGKPCERAGCPNTPRWMTESPAPRREQSERSERSHDQRSREQGGDLSSRTKPPAAPSGPAGQTLSSPDSLSSQGEDRPWPTLEDAALHGLAGDVVRTLEPHTEADPAGLLLVFLTMFGNAVGRGPHAIADAAEHPARLFVVLVGDTARARKGTAQANVNRLMEAAAPGWYEGRVMGGLASGEGLIAAANGEDGKDDDDEEEPPADQRVMVVEPEFARVLAVASREGSTLSAILRQAWDDGRLRIMTRKNPLIATGAHVSVVGHITIEELTRRLLEVEVANGFMNRHLLACVRRSKHLPHGGNLDPAALDDLAGRIGDVIGRMSWITSMRRSEAASRLWEQAYTEFDDGPGGLAGALVARPEAQTLRLSVCYALLDGSAVIEVDHLRAALAVWRYCEASALYVFGDALGDPVADQLLAGIAEAGRAGLDGAAQHALFGRHVTAARLAQVRGELERRGLIVTISEETGGRPRLVSRAVVR